MLVVARTGQQLGRAGAYRRRQIWRGFFALVDTARLFAGVAAHFLLHRAMIISSK